ncbi:MAG: phytanoyl-CoA dioxygenase family protein [Nocardioidaceae bacterium]
MTTTTGTAFNVDEITRGLYTDGIAALKGAFPRDWVAMMRADMDVAFEDAVARPGGAVGRGPERYYVEVHPEQLRGFVDLVSHPWVVAVSEVVLGADYEIVEVGFDIPFPGAVNQPWHRDFPSPESTYKDRRLTSLAFNLTGVDTVAEMGPFEIAVGSQWDQGEDWEHQMFPQQDQWPRFASLAQQKLPQMGDLSVRSALTIHRGTANVSSEARPVLVLGVDAPGAGHAELHDMTVTHAFYASLPNQIRGHLSCRTVDTLEPIVQKHTIEGLVMDAP